jgi:transcriptional regulator with XRE-family HTH domain
MKIGNAIKECRTRANLTQLQLAKKAKVTQGYIANVEKNNLTPSQKVISRISDALGVPPIALIVLATESSDVKRSKKYLFKSLKPVIDGLVENILNEVYGKPTS